MPKKKADVVAKKGTREGLPRAAHEKRRVDGLFSSPATAPEPPKSKKKVVKKKKKAVGRKTKPPYMVMIRRALIHLNARNGSSLFAIYKHLEENYPVSESFHRYVGAALREGVSEGIVARVRMSYKLTTKGRAHLSRKTRRVKKKTIKKKKADKKKTAGKKKKKGDAGKKRKRPAKKAKADAKKKTSAKKKEPAKKKARTPKKKDGLGEKEKDAPKKKDARSKKIELATPAKGGLHISPAGHKFRWQYQDGTWKDYEANASDVVETAYQHYVKNPGMCDVRSVKSGQWQYQVDFLNLKQTNIQHENHTARSIRRLPLNE